MHNHQPLWYIDIVCHSPRCAMSIILPSKMSAANVKDAIKNRARSGAPIRPLNTGIRLFLDHFSQLCQSRTGFNYQGILLAGSHLPFSVTNRERAYAAIELNVLFWSVARAISSLCVFSSTLTWIIFDFMSTIVFD